MYFSSNFENISNSCSSLRNPVHHINYLCLWKRRLYYVDILKRTSIMCIRTCTFKPQHLSVTRQLQSNKSYSLTDDSSDSRRYFLLSFFHHSFTLSHDYVSSLVKWSKHRNHCLGFNGKIFDM